MLKDFRVTDSLELEGFRVKGIWRLHDLGVKRSLACYELRMLQRDRVQWITAADTPSCGQKKHTRWPATNSKCWCAIMRSEKTHTLAGNEFFGTQWITDAAARSDAMSDGCWYAIVQPEKTHTLACNKFFGVQWMTDAAARSCAMNYGCWFAIVRSEKTHTLACNECQVLVGHRAIRKDTHADRHATNSGWWCNHTRWYATNSGWSCNFVPSEKCQRSNVCLYVYLLIKMLSLYIYIYLSLSLYLCVCLCVYLSIYLSMSLPIYFSLSWYLTISLCVYVSIYLSRHLFL